MEYKLFDLIPNGVVVFKNQRVTYINRHILDILNIAYLDKNSAVDIISRTMQVSSEKELYEYFSQHEYFIHNQKVIQIEHTRSENLDIYSFMRIHPSLVDMQNRQDTVLRSQKSSIDEKVAQHFKLHNISSVMVLTFYKGLPLKNKATILKINQNSIELRVDKKHKISLKERDDIIVLMNAKKGATALHGQVFRSDGEIFTIQNFALIKEDMHLREGVRIKPDDDMHVVVNEKTYKVYDLSLEAVSIYVSSEDEIQTLKPIKYVKLGFYDKTIRINVAFHKAIYYEGKILKAVFMMYNSGKNSDMIHTYINMRQTQIIKEIHAFRKSQLL